MNNFDAIPSELKELKNWVLWKYVDKGGPKPTKVPYNVDNYEASSTNPNRWSTFDNVIRCYNVGGYDGIGFVFTNTEYSGIDLDDCSILPDGSPNPNRSIDLDRQIKIFNEFDSYSERSPSKKGLHVIVKGTVPDGKKLAFIELYPTARYFTMTGDVYNNKPIVERQNMLTQLWLQMGGGKEEVVSVQSQKEILTDEQILELSYKHNSEKFVPLSRGEWQGRYPSQSEADQAYMNIVSHYTNNKEQAVRIYSKSELAKTDKKRRELYYLNRTVNTAFDQKLSPVEFIGYEQLALPLADSYNGSTAAFDVASNGSIPLSASTSVAQRLEPTPHKSKDAGSNPAASTITFPTGLIGEISQFIYDAAPRPVKEVALAGALSLMSGICGRAYNVSGTGLNQYILVLAKTGVGKEQAAEGIDKIMSTIRLQVPGSSSFIGPSEISSGPGLFKYLANNSQSFVSILGEFGLRLKALSSPNASSSEISLRRIILDVYHKSGQLRSLPSSAYSKKEDSTNAIPSPAFSILGEGTPETFYDNLTEDMISEGLLPRFLIIEYPGDRVNPNKHHNQVIPDFTLVQKMSTLAGYCDTINYRNPRKAIDVLYTDEALQQLDKFNDYADNKVRGSKEIIRQLWNRAHLKVLKLAALIAVGNDYLNPIITINDVDWAIALVNVDINNIAHRFDTGLIGGNTLELKQMEELTRILKEYVEKDFEYVSKYKAIQSLHTSKIVCNTYLSLRLSKMAAFKNDRSGGTNALKRSIQTMIDNGILKLAGGIDFQEKHKTTVKAYHVNINLIKWD